MVGQEFVVATLKSSITQGRIAHAYLFSGPRGIGKTSAARILAKALNCEKGPTASPCGECEACREITAGNALDVMEIDGASNTSVNDVREIKDEVLFSPNSSRYKVYIIDEVHMLSNSAFNALLKTIEEPPPYIVFIFATTEIHRVPATIRSRCQQFNFRLISVSDIRARLSEVLNELGLEGEEEALMWIAREATGSLRDAYTLLDQIISFSGKKVTLEKIKEKLGIVGLDELNVILERLSGGDAKGVLEETGEILERGVAVEQFVIDLAEYFRNILFITQGVRAESVLGISKESLPETLWSRFSVPQLEKAVEYLLELYRKLRYSLNPRFELELTLSRLCRLNSLITNEEILSALSVMRSDVSTHTGGSDDGLAQSNTPSENVRATDPPQPKTSGQFRSQADVIAAFKRSRPTLASALEKALRWYEEGPAVRLVFKEDNRFSAEMVLKERKDLESKLSEILSRSVRIEIEYESHDRDDSGRDDGLDSQVEMVKRVFKGEVIQGD
jgi:DNA polymerase-3 subunit gamma/tau